MPHPLNATIDDLFCRECGEYIHPDAPKCKPPLCAYCQAATLTIPSAEASGHRMMPLRNFRDGSGESCRVTDLRVRNYNGRFRK
jgi:hypothetical protein